MRGALFPAVSPPLGPATIPERARPDAVADPLAADSREAQLLGVRPVDDPALAAQAGPVTFANAQAPRALLVHGDADRFVPYQQSVEMAEALRAVGAEAEVDIVPGADHFWLGIDVLDHVLPRTLAFL